MSILWPNRLGEQNTPTASQQKGNTLPMSVLWLNRLGLKNTPTASQQKGNTLPISVLWPNRLGEQNTPTSFLQRSQSVPSECPGYNTKQSNGDVSVMLELWGMQSTPLSPSLQCLFWLSIVAPDKAVSMG